TEAASSHAAPDPVIVFLSRRQVRAVEEYRVSLAAQRQVDGFRLVAILGSITQEHSHHPDESTQTKFLQSPGDSVGSRSPGCRKSESLAPVATIRLNYRDEKIEIWSRAKLKYGPQASSLDFGLAPR